MFEARLAQGSTLKSTIEAMKDLVTDANLDCSANGLSLQAMDSSHVSLCALLMRADGFDHFRCDKNISLGLNLTITRVVFSTLTKGFDGANSNVRVADPLVKQIAGRSHEKRTEYF